MALTSFTENTILRAQLLPRRKVGGKRHLLRVIQKVEGEQLLRWDSLFIVPINREAMQISDHITKSRVGPWTKKFAFTYPGDTLIVDNWRMLHGRSSVPDSCVDRLIERVYLRKMNS